MCSLVHVYNIDTFNCQTQVYLCIHFMRRCREVGSPSASGLTGYSLWLPWFSISSLTCMPKPFPECYGVKEKDPRIYAFDGKPKTVEEAIDRLQFFQHSRQGRPPKPKRDVVRVVSSEEAPQGLGVVLQ